MGVIGVWEGVVRGHEVFGEEGVPFDGAQDDELMLLANSVSGYGLGELSWGYAHYCGETGVGGFALRNVNRAEFSRIDPYSDG